MKRDFTQMQLDQADQRINRKQKVYFPWHQKYFERVVKKDEKGYYMRLKGERVTCVPELDCLDKNVKGFVAIKRG